MPTIEVITGTITTNLNNNAPFRLTNSDDLFNFAPVRRLRERGPSQHGHTDLGGRLDAPTITLQFDFHASGGSALDGYRDTLRRTFPASPGSPLYLRYTRDDGEVRQLDVYRVGPVGIPADVGQRAAKLHRAVVQLEAPDATWYDPTQLTVSPLTLSDWWLAANTIGSANVLEHTENPGTAQVWTYAGSVAAGSPWMIAFRSGTAGTSGSAWAFESAGLRSSLYVDSGNYQVAINGGVDGFVSGTSLIAPGTHNYFLTTNGGTSFFYRDTELIYQNNASDPPLQGSVPSGRARWRSSYLSPFTPTWPVALPKVAVYNICPTASQLAALSNAMDVSGTASTGSVAYRGDWPEYPVVRIYGPISDPVLTNASTGESLDFTGYTIGSGDYYEVDTRYGYKTARNSGGDNKIGELTSDSDLETFHLGSDYEAAGGVNILSLTGTATGTATAVTFYYYNRYTGP